MKQQIYDFGEVNLTEQELIFCRLLQFNLSPTFAAEAVKLDTPLLTMHGYTFEKLGNSMLNRTHVQKYLRTSKIYKVKDNPHYDIVARAEKDGLTPDDINAYTEENLKTIRAGFSIKQSAFCYLVALGNSVTASANIALCGKNTATQKSMGGRYLRDKDTVVFISRLALRYLADSSYLPLVSPAQLLVEAKTLTSYDVKERLIELELAARNFRTKVVEPAVRQITEQMENLKELDKAAENFAEELSKMQQELTETGEEDDLL